MMPSTLILCSVRFFFFQAEDGIRDLTVTGVQTCALPISLGERTLEERKLVTVLFVDPEMSAKRTVTSLRSSSVLSPSAAPQAGQNWAPEIGRASCRERVEISVVAGSLKKKRRR